MKRISYCDQLSIGEKATMQKRFLYLSQKDVQSIINGNYGFIIETIEDALRLLKSGNTIQPDKISQIFDSQYQNRINCMPSSLLSLKTSGMKWVSVFPSNKGKGLENVEGFTLLSETETGGIKCFMNATDCTSLRTAAVGAVAAKYLARKETTSIGFIGAGAEARAHFRMIRYVYPAINTCYVSSRTDGRINSFIKELSNEYQDVQFVHCNNRFEEAIIHSDIIVTAISSQAQVLKSEWIRPGMLYIHVAGLEDEFGVVEKADKIVCDNWECVKHRTQTITQMYNAGLLSDKDIYGDIGDILVGEKSGRENDEEFIYFNSVGLSVEDILLADRIYNSAIDKGIGTWIEK